MQSNVGLSYRHLSVKIAKRRAECNPEKDIEITCEFAGHEAITSKLGVDVYFAHPYHSWERGLSENTNGLIRQYFPRKTYFRGISDKDVLLVR